MTQRLEQLICGKLKNLPTEPYLCWQKTWWSRGAFLELIEECEAMLRSSRFKKGQRLALLLPNSPVFFALSIAVWKMGGTVVPIDYRGGYVTIIKQLQHADVFAAVAWRGCSDTAPLISEDGIPCFITELDKAMEPMDGRPSTKESEDTAVIFYTSGTTGEPKAVPLSHDNLIGCIDACVAHISTMDEDDVVLNALPNFNAFGFICGSLMPLVTATPHVALPSFLPVESAMDAIKSAPVTIIPAVPTIISFIIGAVARGVRLPSSLKCIISGGDKLSDELRERCKKTLGVPILEGYGLTEASSVVSIAPGIDKIKEGTLGTLLPCVEAEIRSDGGEVLPAGGEGRLWVRGSSVTSCYYRNPELTAQRFVDGWFDTCDIASIDDEGYLSLVARTTDVIFVGGFKVYAGEVERALLEHPAVAEAAVIGVPRSISGEIVKAFILPKKGEKPTAKELLDSCREKLSYYKVPRIIEFVDKMPRSGIGEIIKRKLERD